MTGYSGVELWTLDMAVALRRAGHQVSVQAQLWEDHYKAPLLAARVECNDFDHFPDCIDVNISPKFACYRSAGITNRPILQVLHSEHLTDLPMKTPYLPAGIILIRRGQKFLLDIEPQDVVIPYRVIRNPIDFSRFGAMPEVEKTFACVMLSEFDDMKAELAEEVQKRCGGEVLLVGPWRSELPVPEHCTHEQPTLDVRQAYARARMVFSYRLSRQYAEGIYCGLPVLVRGKLEPELVTRHDWVDDWTVHDVNAESKALAFEFNAELVAQQVVAFAKEVLAR
jgi:hypothetical protein